jgi:hypothetical protein
MTPKEKLIKEFEDMFNLVESQVGVNERERFSKAIDEYVKEKVDDAYKKGYNQRLKDEGKVGERWQHLYL